MQTYTVYVRTYDHQASCGLCFFLISQNKLPNMPLCCGVFVVSATAAVLYHTAPLPCTRPIITRDAVRARHAAVRKRHATGGAFTLILHGGTSPLASHHPAETQQFFFRNNFPNMPLALGCWLYPRGAVLYHTATQPANLPTVRTAPAASISCSHTPNVETTCIGTRAQPLRM